MTDANPVIHVIDDDDAMRDSMTWLLEGEGYAVAAYASAPAFLAARRDDMRGCLVLDVRMPDMSGLELQERLDALGSTLPIVFITGHGDVPMAVAALHRGACDFVQKPFTGITGPLTSALTQIASLGPGIKALVGFVGFVVALISLAALRNFGPVLFYVGLAIFAAVGLVIAGAIMGAVI